MDETKQQPQDSLPETQGQASGGSDGTTSQGTSRDSEDSKRISDAKAAEGRARKAELESERDQLKAQLNEANAKLAALEQKLAREKAAVEIAQRHGVDPYKLVEYADLPSEKLEKLAQDLVAGIRRGVTGDSGLSTGTPGAWTPTQVEKMSIDEVNRKLYSQK